MTMITSTDLRQKQAHQHQHQRKIVHQQQHQYATTTSHRNGSQNVIDELRI